MKHADEHHWLLGQHDVDVIQGSLDSMAVALAEHGHHWTANERLRYVAAHEILEREASTMAKPIGKAPGNKKGGSTGVKKGKPPQKTKAKKA